MVSYLAGYLPYRVLFIGLILKFLKSQEIFFSHGITAVHSFETLTEYKILYELEQEGKLKLRIYHTVHEDEQDDFDTWNNIHHSGSDLLWHGHIKMFADGSLGVKSAYLHEPYEGSMNNYGISCMTPKEMVKNVERAYATGRGVIIHAIGDRALTQTLDAIEQARKKYPGTHHDRIEHLQLTRTEDLKRMKKLDIGAGIPGFDNSQTQANRINFLSQDSSPALS